MKTKTYKPYRAYIAANQETPAILYTESNTAKGAVISIKRRIREWQDLFIWVEFNGEKI